MSRARPEQVTVQDRASSDCSWLLSAELPGVVGRFDVAVKGGCIVEISEASSSRIESCTESEEILDGLLLLPALEEHHAHLDKALTADFIVNRSGDLTGAIEAWIEAEDSGLLDLEEMQKRAEESLRDLVLSGVSRVRSHVNVGGSDALQRNLRAVSAARESFKDLIDVEIVALMHSPLSGEEGRSNRIALDKAIEFGVDLIGGCPHLEIDSEGMISHILRVARSAGLPIDLHIDETTDARMVSVEMLAKEILDTGFPLPVSASHCVSLSMQSLDDQIRLAKLLQKAEIRVVALPQTNLYLQGWNHPRATPRGIAPLSLLKDHGVEIAAGGDNVQDPFNPMGRNDPLETASLLVTAAHLDPLEAYRTVGSVDMPLHDPLTSWLGRRADFLAIRASNVRSAIAHGSQERRTVRGGRVIAVSTVNRRILPSF